MGSYTYQTAQITPPLADRLPKYEKLTIDFIPVSDTEYFIFDKCTNSFEGFIYISATTITNKLTS